MAECDVCGREQNMPYECNRCSGTFCVEHRLPESHDCPGLNAWSGAEGSGALGGTGQGTASHRQGGGPIGADSGGLASKLPFDTGPGGISAYFRNNTTFVFLIAIWITFVLQLTALFVGGDSLHDALFVSSPEHIFYVWTWFTSVFAHSTESFWHIAMNSLVLYFFGPVVERKLGSKRFALLFLGAGAIASLGASAIPLLLGLYTPGGLGASGAILGIMGVLTVLNPDLRVMLLFPPIPMPLWVMTAGIAAISVFFLGLGGPAAGGIGHLAHLLGLIVGLAYGYRLKEQGMTGPQQLQMGGGGPGGGLGGGRRRF